MQFFFILYVYNYHWKIIYNNGWYNISNKRFLKMSKHMCMTLFNFAILNESDLLWYPPYKYNLYSGSFTHYKWTNIEFNHYTQYSTECAMCHHLTALTNSFLLLNICPTSKLDPYVITHNWYKIILSFSNLIPLNYFNINLIIIPPKSIINYIFFCI
jgi:hypothetical protein